MIYIIEESSVPESPNFGNKVDKQGKRDINIFFGFF